MARPSFVDNAPDELIDLFRIAEQSILEEVAQLAGDPAQFRRANRLAELQRTVDFHLRAIEANTREWCSGTLPEVYALGVDNAALRAAADTFEWTQVHVDAVQQLAGDTFDDVLSATTYVRDDVKSWIRQAGRRETALSLVEGRTAQQAGRELAKMAAGEAVNVLGGPITAIRYADGSYRRFADHADMLLRTKTAVAYNTGTTNQLEVLEISFVECFDGGSCGLTGHDDREKPDGRVYQLEVAQQHPISHPRCRRSWGGRPDVTSPAEAAAAEPSTTEEQRQDQRALEARQEAAVTRRAATRAATKPTAPPKRPSRPTRTPRSGGAAARPGRGARTPRAPRAPSKPPVPAVKAGPTDIPVSQSADIRTRVQRVRDATTHALEQIDAVHSDGQLPKIPITGQPMSGARGHFGRAPLEIAVRGSGDWPELTAVHEYGHFLDFAGVGQPGHMSSLAARTAPEVPELAEWVAATDASDAITALQAMEPNARGRELRHIRYLLSDHERWARSYAQWIATRSGDPLLLEQLARAQQGRFPAQWSDEDFVPIGEAIDRLMAALGWTG